MSNRCESRRDEQSIRNFPNTACRLRLIWLTGRAHFYSARPPEPSIPGWAGKFLDPVCTQTLRSRIAPMKKIALTLRTHRDLLLNYFWDRKAYASGVIKPSKSQNSRYIIHLGSSREPYI